jgi:hypothetical protein
VAAHEQHQAAANIGGEQRQHDGGHQAPHDERVPLPLPNVPDELHGVVRQVLDLMAVEGESAAVEEVDAELDERDEQEQVERGDDMGADLRGELVEAECPGEQDDDDRGESDGRIDADDHAEGEAPGEAARADAAPEEAQERPEDAAADELVDGLGNVHCRVGRPASGVGL